MRIALIGYGKMGKAIEKIAVARGHTISCAIQRDNAAKVSNLDRAEIDLVIEFSTPALAYQHVYSCLEKRLPVLCGTTGWVEQKAELDQYCLDQGGTFFYSTNFSLSVQVFFKVNEMLARYMTFFPDYQVKVEETHHLSKKDQPSGTALEIAKEIIKNRKGFQGWSLADEAIGDTLPIACHRVGEAVGSHKVTYESGREILSLEHISLDRMSFAYGVMQVAEWMYPGQQGVLTMDDFLKDYFSKGL